MGSKKFYPRAAHLLKELLEHLGVKYRTEYQVQTLYAEGPEPKECVFQMRKHYSTETSSTLHKLTGLDLAATAKFRIAADSLDVEVGGGKWLDKAAVAGFATFVAIGLLIIPAGIGAYQQYKLIEELSEEIEKYIRSRMEVKTKADDPAEEVHQRDTDDSKETLQCPGCGGEIKKDMRYCPYCGRNL